MSTQEDPSSETLVGETHVDSADGGETVDSPALSLSELNKYLGSDFKDKDTALKALKDTKDFVGKRKEDIAAEVKASLEPVTPQPDSKVDESLKSDVQSLKDRLFFSENPQYKGYESIIKKMGADPSEVVGSEDFKQLFEKVKVADEAAQKRSVVSSNSRLAENKTTTDNAIEVANARGSTLEDVALALARGINQGDS